LPQNKIFKKNRTGRLPNYKATRKKYNQKETFVFCIQFYCASQYYNGAGKSAKTPPREKMSLTEKTIQHSTGL